MFQDFLQMIRRDFLENISYKVLRSADRSLSQQSVFLSLQIVDQLVEVSVPLNTYIEKDAITLNVVYHLETRIA